MSEPLKRTIFTDRSKGYIQIWDWAEVVTELGTMYEPYYPDQYSINADISDYDAADSMTKVHEIREVSFVDINYALGDDARLHGGHLRPRV